MEVIVKSCDEIKLVGLKITMSFSNDLTFELWNRFMKRRKEIVNLVGNELYCIKVFSNMNFNNVDFNLEFEKWAAVQVSNFDNVPDGMEKFIIPSGLYAVFHYVGAANSAVTPYKYIFTKWIPNSDYEIDNRPHFDVLGAKYKNNDIDSEEDLWIPILPKRA